jgi:hypothetical protein
MLSEAVRPPWLFPPSCAPSTFSASPSARRSESTRPHRGARDLSHKGHYRVKARRGGKKAAVAVAASMLTAAYYILLRGVPY